MDRPNRHISQPVNEGNKIMEFKTAYGEKTPHQIHFPLPSLTKQSFIDECDINTIMKRYEKTALITHVNNFQGDYGDAMGVQDYHASMNQVIAAQAAFSSLPSAVRAQFHNDPGQFLAFAEANPAEIEKLLNPTPENPAEGPSKLAEAPQPGVPSEDNPEPPAAPPAAE